MRVNLHGANVKPGDQVQVAIRPEKVNLSLSSEENVPNAVPGVVEESVFIGTDTRFVIRLTEQTTIVVRCQNATANNADEFPTATAVRIQCRPEYALILTE